MSEPLDDQKRQILDEFYPFIDQDATPPGRWVDHLWLGQSGWRTRHGQSVVVWDAGSPREVNQALYPDGSRGDVWKTLDYGYRRRATGPVRWIYGTIEFRADDVEFTDAAEQPKYTPPALTDKPDLEAELARDDAFLASLRDDRFAYATNSVFRNSRFCKANDDRIWECGERRAARLVANLRGLGESYQDFLFSKISGTWPDDRVRTEAFLRTTIAEASRPIESGFVALWLSRLGRAEHDLSKQQALRDEMEIARADFERHRPEIEAQQRERLASAERSLADFLKNENADVFEALHAHLARLGWRTKSEHGTGGKCRLIVYR